MKNTGKVKRVCLTLEKEILDWIDMERNNVTRSSFINQVLKKEYAHFKKKFYWKTEGMKAEEDIRKGRTKKFSNAKQACEWLKS
jgi:hypothetical protein